ncbi:UDP-glucose 4-epimerase GalE [Streptomyces sp. NPDC018610]|uniref:UDP-glucose 4-epimerase GalE n=1 Tax=Streptomyces sp. NPDC018610 TaxID=3365049 RepID=UPI00379846CD
MSWLVTGGAGYIGAHVVRAMTEGGEDVVVYDDLSTGSAERVPEGVPLVVGSVLDGPLLERTLREHAVTGVVHIAAKKQVGESVERPLRYYRENVTGLQTLLEAMAATGAARLVFSSSAAVYGMPDVALVTEDTPCAPMSPYGETKLIGEWLIAAAAQAHGLRAAALRYFNVAGAAAPELSDAGVFNLVPMVFERLEAGEPPRVFGDDYATPDGTCVRDYIHVQDIASAHLAAARRLADAPEGTSLVLNIGRGEGSSVREMVDRILKTTGNEDVVPEVAARRPGDPARVVASADRIRAELGWSARHGLDEMIESAWLGWRHRHG